MKKLLPAYTYKRQLAVVTADSGIVGVPHIFTNAEYPDMLYADLTQVA
jgi:hypothetical protein